MAHEIKNILSDDRDELDPNDDHKQNTNNVFDFNLSSNSILNSNTILNSSNQNLLDLKNSFTTNTNMQVSTQDSLPQAKLSLLMKNSNGNKFSLNSSGASMSTITSSTKSTHAATGTKMGSRRIFTPQFKLQVLESYRNDDDCKGNQRATARKYGIHRRQIQKWLQCENNLRSIIANNPQNVRSNHMKLISKVTAPILSSSTSSRQRGVVVNTDKNGATYSCFSLANVKDLKTSNSIESLSTKSLPSASMPINEFILKSSNSSSAASLEINKNNQFCYDNDSNLTNIYNHPIDDHPIDLSCNQTKMKIKNVARPIPIHPSSSNYKNPFFNYSIHDATNLTNISNSFIKNVDLVDPIDLSSVSQKRKHKTDNSKSNDNNKPFKLFRPYLENNFETDKDKFNKLACDEAQKHSIVWNNNFHSENFQSEYNYFQVKSLQNGYQTDSPNITQFLSLTSSLSSADDKMKMNSNHHILLPISQASPVSGYDSSTSSIYSFNDNEVELNQGNSPTCTSSHQPSSPSYSSATMSPTTIETKVPLSPSLLHDLKFKLYTLDCYYNDADCKRNEKLVAKKLNINCKVVEKWLRQESDLRKQYHLQIVV